MGGPIVIERKERESIACPDVKHNYVTSSHMIYIVMDRADFKMSAFPSTGLVATDDGLSPVQCQPLIWTNAGILLIGS